MLGIELNRFKNSIRLAKMSYVFVGASQVESDSNKIIQELN